MTEAKPPRRPPPPPIPRGGGHVQRARGPEGIQRRQHPRIDAKLSAEITIYDEVFTATTRDISEGGVGLDLDRPLDEGQTLSLNLFLVVDEVEDETAAPLKVKGKVAWCAETEDGAWAAGVRFEDIAENQRAWLKQFLGYITPPAAKS